MRRILARHEVRDSYDHEWTFKLLGPDDSGDPTKPLYVVAMEPPDSGPHASDDVVRFDAHLFDGISTSFMDQLVDYEPEQSDVRASKHSALDGTGSGEQSGDSEAGRS